MRMGDSDELALLEPAAFIPTATTGFPNPAANHIETPLSLDELLIRRPTATFFLRMEGDALVGDGIHPGDILIVDRALRPAVGDVAILVVAGALLARHYEPTPYGVLYLTATHPDVRPLRIEGEMACEVWGVVTYVIHGVRQRRPQAAQN